MSRTSKSLSKLAKPQARLPLSMECNGLMAWAWQVAWGVSDLVVVVGASHVLPQKNRYHYNKIIPKIHLPNAPKTGNMPFIFINRKTYE